MEVAEDVPEIYDTDPKPLLYHARDTVTDVVQDTPETRKKGWRRLQLFGLYFTPSAIDIKDAYVPFCVCFVAINVSCLTSCLPRRDTALKERRPDINPDFAGVYPWDWVGDDVASFKAISGGLLVAPILQVLILNRNPIEVLDFADKVAQWDIQRIIPGHLKVSVAALQDII